MEHYNIRALVMRERTRCVHFKCWAGCGLRQSYYLESYTLSVVMVDPRDTGAHQCAHVHGHYIGYHTVHRAWKYDIGDMEFTAAEAKGFGSGLGNSPLGYDYSSYRYLTYGQYGFGLTYSSSTLGQCWKNAAGYGLKSEDDSMRTCGLFPLARHATTTFEEQGMSGLQLRYDLKNIAQMVYILTFHVLLHDGVTSNQRALIVHVYDAQCHGTVAFCDEMELLGDGQMDTSLERVI